MCRSVYFGHWDTLYISSRGRKLGCGFLQPRWHLNTCSLTGQLGRHFQSVSPPVAVAKSHTVPLRALSSKYVCHMQTIEANLFPFWFFDGAKSGASTATVHIGIFLTLKLFLSIFLVQYCHAPHSLQGAELGGWKVDVSFQLNDNIISINYNMMWHSRVYFWFNLGGCLKTLVKVLGKNHSISLDSHVNRIIMVYCHIFNHVNSLPRLLHVLLLHVNTSKSSTTLFICKQNKPKAAKQYNVSFLLYIVCPL